MGSSCAVERKLGAPLLEAGCGSDHKSSTQELRDFVGFLVPGRLDFSVRWLPVQSEMVHVEEPRMVLHVAGPP